MPPSDPRSTKAHEPPRLIGDYAALLTDIGQRNLRSLQEATEQFFGMWSETLAAWPQVAAASVEDRQAYAVDAGQRALLFADIMRRRGNQFRAIEETDSDSVLAFAHELILDGANLPRPINYSLVRIVPAADCPVRDNTRPYVIIDPRAGHGSGIGGFKNESEVGVALRAGHPVYFVIFSRHPRPGQTLADICRGEAEFLREVRRRHPDSPKPVVVGNCQGGWAAMLLAGAYPDLTGPVVANGAPLSYWAGLRGRNPMRYLGGLSGGSFPALLLADLGGGEFDGAHLVLNFEALNPANTWWRKYYDVFLKTDAIAEHFLGFERWWSAFYFMTADEIGWITENLFIGNRPARGGVYLDSGLHVDLRKIRAPIILFASHGDNITPVPQAVSWVTDVYRNVREIQAYGQRIIYTVHDSVGHLGIFVSGSVALKEHQEITSTLRTIEALAPGLYEMKIVEATGEGENRRFEVSFEERELEDLAAFDHDRDDETPFAAVAGLSEWLAGGYRIGLRPLVRAVASPELARILRDAHPLRLQRSLLSDANPLLAGMAGQAAQVRRQRRPAAPDNVLLRHEQRLAGLVESGWNWLRAWRDGWVEMAFYSLYAAPAARALADGIRPRIAESQGEDLRSVNDVSRALDSIELGGYPNALVRILILLARSRGSVRRDRLERSNRLLSTEPPFAGLSPVVRARIIRQQSLIIEFEPDLALASLPRMLPSTAERETALAQAQYVLGSADEMSAETRAMLQAIRQVLGVDTAPPGSRTGSGEEGAKRRGARPKRANRHQLSSEV